MSSRNSTSHGDKKATSDAPFPETDFSPALQRTLKRKFDAGEIDGALGHALDAPDESDE